MTRNQYTEILRKTGSERDATKPRLKKIRFTKQTETQAWSWIGNMRTITNSSPRHTTYENCRTDTYILQNVKMPFKPSNRNLSHAQSWPFPTIICNLNYIQTPAPELMQKYPDGSTRVISYGGRTLSKAEKNAESQNCNYWH